MQSSTQTASSPISSTPVGSLSLNHHAFRSPGPEDSRCPCPALNTLANHGYLPRDGKNISMKDLIKALTHPDTYNLSPALALVLAEGGAVLTEETLFDHLNVIFLNDTICLHDLSLHGGVEHNASIVHKNTPAGDRYAPTRTDTRLLDAFVGTRSEIGLADIASRRVQLERVSPIEAVHAEIARGEWALVLDVFGRAHGGKIPVDKLRVWLYENRFPEGWKPDHKQKFWPTVETSKKIRHEMNHCRERMTNGVWTMEDSRNRSLLCDEPEQLESHN